MGVASEDKAITLGHPSYIWRFGQERRLALIRRYVSLEKRRILDIGCGIGAYVRAFRRYSEDVYGLDIERERVLRGSQALPNLMAAVSEHLPFKDEVFDVVLLHEVIEHVTDDHRTIVEACRILRPGGAIVIYAPNRLYPFETHGFYLGKRYIFQLLPLVNWLPDRLRRIFVPHVRAYTTNDIKRLYGALDLTSIIHTYVYPGFDGIAYRWPALARLMRGVFYFLEASPLRIFGLSHFIVLRKSQAGAGQER
ncbi:MAG: class I SAM-dependent methyltransferase [Chloroflexi bacterium]|nr:class I SAM-dependent methyltransferase [Chloroflexota bacterium]